MLNVTLSKITALTDSIRSVEPVAPSILKQSPFRTGFFSFGKAKRNGVDYFNCSIVTRPDGDWLITRRSQYHQHLEHGQNDLMAFSLDRHKNPSMGYKVTVIESHPDEHFEDPRAIVHDGKVWIGVCNFFVLNKGKRWTGAHQALLSVDEGWRSTARFDPEYGNNGPGTMMNKGHEKNWLWFFHEEIPHMIYSATPHRVVRCPMFIPEETFSTPNDLPWKWGEIRGGTPPVLVNDEYWTFFHSSLPWREKKPVRRYYMGAYAFESSPPFSITRITTMPILSGSPDDRWADSKPLVVFPGGSLLKNGTWTVVGGCNDLDCFWIDIPHRDLLSMTTPA
jgi:predicted GH43/DUF377 family glycosyl hydrolase